MSSFVLPFLLFTIQMHYALADSLPRLSKKELGFFCCFCSEEFPLPLGA